MSFTNLLPQDGSAYYLPEFLAQSESTEFYQHLLNTIAWRSERIKLFGKEHAIPRLSAWYGEPGKRYSYSGLQLQPHAWNEHLLELKRLIEARIETSFNSVLLNFYRDGSDHVAWHADNEPELGPEPIIASLSLGASRFFHLRHRYRNDLKLKLELQGGSLLVMRGKTQQLWLHRISPSKRVMHGRINLTFRNIK